MALTALSALETRTMGTMPIPVMKERISWDVIELLRYQRPAS